MALIDAPSNDGLPMEPRSVETAANVPSFRGPPLGGDTEPVKTLCTGAPRPVPPLPQLSSAQDASDTDEVEPVGDMVAQLNRVPSQIRASECAKRREQIRAAIKQLDKSLDENEEVVKLRPSKNDKLTAGSYHDCFRRLHWVLERCSDLQEIASRLEDYDSERLVNKTVSLEYALLSVDLVARHDHATRLLKLLCGLSDARDKEVHSARRRNPRVSDWLTETFYACGGRACMRDMPGYCATPAK